MSDKKRRINTDLLPTEKEKQYSLPSPGTQIDYSRFVSNNWLKADSKNELLKSIEQMGGALWFGHDGVIRWRVRADEDVMVIENDEQARRSISSVLGREKIRLFKGIGSGRDALPPEIYPHELLAAKDLFTPFALSEFYLDKTIWYRTAFKPTEYIKKRYGKAETKEPDTILCIINNLAGGKDKYHNWILNWLAGFFQTLRKSQVALVLRGDQGSGKGLFFTKIITPLFGKDYCITVDSNNLESNFKNWVDGRLFLNLNEVAVDMKGRRNVKNFLKQLVTDEFVNVETKFRDAGEKRAYANILITSNEAFPIEIEPSDRRFTVFQTGKGLKAQGWDMDKTVADIKEELPILAEYLHNFKVDWALYDTALDTPEKQAIVDGTTSNIRRYATAIVNKDLQFFLEFKEDIETARTYIGLQDSFSRGKITQGLLYQAFDKMFETKKTSKKMMGELRGQMPEVFGLHKLKTGSGYKYYEI